MVDELGQYLHDSNQPATLDERVLADLSRPFIGNASRSVIENYLHRGLGSLFGSPPQR